MKEGKGLILQFLVSKVCFTEATFFLSYGALRSFYLAAILHIHQYSIPPMQSASISNSGHLPLALSIFRTGTVLKPCGIGMSSSFGIYIDVASSLIVVPAPVNSDMVSVLRVAVTISPV